MNFDELRAAHPDLRFNVYAMTPGGLVTLEIVTPDDDVFTFQAPTVPEAAAVAFPPEPPVNAFD